jgi:hypothetical protein
LLRGFVGLGIPFLAVVPTIPILSHSTRTLLGLPVAVAWLFACIPLTSACLATCWFAHDRHLPDVETESPLQ